MKELTAGADLREARILGLGTYRPGRVVTNEEVGAACGVDDAWIRSRTGVSSRRIAAPAETLSVMAEQAARNACQAAGVAPEDVGCVLLATMSHTRQMPPLAPEVAWRIGAGAAAAYDVSAACSGFCYTLSLASDYVRSGSTEHALVIGVERMSDITNPGDRGTAPVFADGAGAFLIGPSSTRGIGPVVWGSDGAASNVLRMSATWAQAMADPSVQRPTVVMEGGKVWSWVRAEVVSAIRKVLDLSGTSVDGLDAFVPHQANLRIIDMLVERLAIPPRVAVARDITDTGNTGAASVPLAVDRLQAEGKAGSGDLTLLFGFGAGLGYAGQLVVLP
jgi:3-oxoacyl-[acyl-carrier-protein] synthase III